MKRKFLLSLILAMPVMLCAQQERKGWYAGVGAGYGSYGLDLYNYNGGSDAYADQKMTQPVIWLSIEKKSVWQKEKFVLDAGAELTGGFGLKVKGQASGGSYKAQSGGWSLGIRMLAKAGYLSGKDGTIVPLIGAGPYFISLQSGGDDGAANRIYGVQGYVGVDFRLAGITVTPQVHFGVASWGSSDAALGSADNSQNGQPSMLEAGIKVALHL